MSAISLFSATIISFGTVVTQLWLLMFLLPAVIVFAQRLPELEISDAELRSFVDQMREESPPLLDVPVNFQGHTSPRDNKDQASRGLFQNIDPSVVTSRSGSVRKLIRLYDNYVPQTGLPEVETEEERGEVSEFLQEVIQSPPMQKLYQLLQQKGHLFAGSPSTFRSSLQQLWFGQYSRAKGEPDSSGFEHVFIGEFKNGEVSGLHNWIRFFYLEKNSGRNRFDYMGFLVKRENIFGAVKFSWAGNVKPTGSFLIGTAPEFDFALFTLCFLARRGGGATRSCNFDIDGCPLSVTSFDLVQRGRVFIGSMYPTAGRMTAECRSRAGSRRQRTGL